MSGKQTAEEIAAAREMLCVVRDETWTDSFEKAAHEFWLETGYMAPGKDVSVRMNKSQEWEESRRPAWEEWSRRRALAVNATLFAALNALERVAEFRDWLAARAADYRYRTDVAPELRMVLDKFYAMVRT